MGVGRPTKGDPSFGDAGVRRLPYLYTPGHSGIKGMETKWPS